MQKSSVNFALFSCIGHKYGLGHFKRILKIAKDLRIVFNNSNITLILLNSKNYSLESKLLNDFSNIIYVDSLCFLDKNIINFNHVFVFDLHNSFIDLNLKNLLENLYQLSKYIVGIDNIALIEDKYLHLRWVPSFFRNPEWSQKFKIEYGWTHYLIDKNPVNKTNIYGNKLLVLTGGSDFFNLSNIWPVLLERMIDQSLEINWVVGPFAEFNFCIPNGSHHSWNIHKSPSSINQLFCNADYVLTVHGVSLFEALAFEKLTVCYVPKEHISVLEYEELLKLDYLKTSNEFEESIKQLNDIINLSKYEKDAMLLTLDNLIDGKGSSRLAEEILRKVTLDKYFS